MFSALDIVNRALERERWARAKLATHADRAVRIVIGPASRAFAIDADGRLHESEAVADLKLTILPLQLPALLAQPERWGELVVADGDAALEATLRELAHRCRGSSRTYSPGRSARSVVRRSPSSGGVCWRFRATRRSALATAS